MVCYTLLVFFFFLMFLGFLCFLEVPGLLLNTKTYPKDAKKMIRQAVFHPKGQQSLDKDQSPPRSLKIARIAGYTF